MMSAQKAKQEYSTSLVSGFLYGGMGETWKIKLDDVAQDTYEFCICGDFKIMHLNWNNCYHEGGILHIFFPACKGLNLLSHLQRITTRD